MSQGVDRGHSVAFSPGVRPPVQQCLGREKQADEDDQAIVGGFQSALHSVEGGDVRPTQGMDHAVKKREQHQLPRGRT
ncbi:hypothetical protein C6366_05120 [Desulfonatronum sp. SC1]|nr:hypothetical protein C6366_05120 [Desulfonatronum sp. SC1]